MALNLNESWKEAYSEYLAEQEAAFDNEIDETLLELSNAQMEAQAGFSMIREYYEVFALTEGVIIDESIGEGDEISEDGVIHTKSESYSKDKDSSVRKTKSETTRQSPSITSSMLKSLMATVADGFDVKETTDTKHDKSYSAGTTGYVATNSVQVEDIGDMKFPKNVIFFIGQLIKWIRNLVLYFIEKFKNIFRRLMNMPTKELNPEAIKLQLQRVKKIESISTVASGASAGKVVTPRMISADKLESILTESLADDLGLTRKNAQPIKTQPIIVTIDFARDIQNIRAYADHFLKLFDHAYGSSGEYLFGTDDLEIILNIFKDTITRLKTGNIAQYSVSGGVAIDADGVNPQKVKMNLVNTNQNINNLKQAFVDTSAKIQDITKIVNSKEMLMLSDMGASYKMLTTETYTQILSILEVLAPYFKKSKDLEKNMGKMKAEYSKLVTELQGMQRSFAGVSNVTFDTIYNRKVIELLNSASWMSDTVSLRLAGIGLYIKELKSVRDALVMVSNLNAGPRGGKLKDFIEANERGKLSRKLYKHD